MVPNVVVSHACYCSMVAYHGLVQDHFLRHEVPANQPTVFATCQQYCPSLTKIRRLSHAKIDTVLVILVAQICLDQIRLQVIHTKLTIHVRDKHVLSIWRQTAR